MFFGKGKTAEAAELDMSNIPKHIGIIMDGNGRWANRKGLPRSAGHRKGAETLEKILKYCASLGVEAVTAYAFSTENWNRPQDEVDALMNLLYEYLMQAEKRFAENDTKFVVSGDISRFDERLRSAIDHAVNVTKDGGRITLNLALNYGGRDEIVRASRKLCARTADGKLSPAEIDEAMFAEFLDTAQLPEVDLIIRPSGEMRLSNFLLWQAAYAEFWYSDICWPDFKEKDMDAAITDYQRRNRRFGGV